MGKKRVSTAEQLARNRAGSCFICGFFSCFLREDLTRTHQNTQTLTSDSGIAAAALGQDFTEQVLAAAASEVAVMMVGMMKVVVVASSFHTAEA